jgi:tetratricopeptide (TPR) repeat protein
MDIMPRLRFALLFAVAVTAASSVSATPRDLQLDDLPVPLISGNIRSEAAEDRLAALVHFAAGRTMQQRGDFAAACRHFARADRLDPVSRTARSALVACAIDRKQYSLAIRYAAKGIDPEEAGEEALELLADYSLKTGNVPAAIEYSEQLLHCLTTEKERAAARSDDEAVARVQIADLNVRFALRELYGLAGKSALAAGEAARVMEILDHPERLHVKREAVAALLDVEPRVAYRALGDAFLMADRLAEAEAAFRKSHELKPDETALDFNLARIAVRRGRGQEALAKLQPYFERHLSNEDVLPYQTLADALKKLGKENELLDRLQKLYEADLTNSPLSYFLAAEYLKAGKLELAEPIYTALSSRGANLLTDQPLAEIYRKEHRPDKLLALLGKVTAATGTLETLGPEAKLLTSDAALFRSLVEAGRKKGGAAPARGDYAEFLSLGILAQERKQYDTADEFFELAVKADPSKAAEVLLAWGVGNLAEERPAQAAKIFQRGIDSQVMPGGNPVFHFYLSGALAAEEAADAVKLDAALASARTAARLKPDSARFAARPPWILFRARRYQESLAAYEKLLEKFGGARSAGLSRNGGEKPPEGGTANASEPESLETSLVLREVRLELSGVCVAVGRMDEAEERLEEVLDEFPDDVEAENDLGFLWADQNKHLQRALTMVRAAVAAQPDNRAYRDSLGWVYYRLGRYGAAIVELEKALDEKQPDGTILDHLGDAYQKAGKMDRAVAAWRRAKAAYEKDKEPEKARKVDQKTKTVR